MAIKRVKDMDEFERAIVKTVWNYAVNLPHDGRWAKYSAKLQFKGKWYTITCQFSYDGITFNYRDLTTVADTQTIWLDPKDFH